ncbi:hypothetical protein FML39_02255 [Klebsiella variicola]|nr:hypothetical protein [Klebsiella variicola]MBZ7888067.1 hypothetical protein [Klebsiella variicola]
MMRQVNYSQACNTLYNVTTLPLCRIYTKYNGIRSQLISKEIKSRLLPLKGGNSAAKITLHHKCYCAIASQNAITNH